MAISLTSSGEEWLFYHLLLTYNGQEWQFHIATDIKWSRMSISVVGLLSVNGRYL